VVMVGGTAARKESNSAAGWLASSSYPAHLIRYCFRRFLTLRAGVGRGGVWVRSEPRLMMRRARHLPATAPQ
jgi:hypothetical protein